MRRLVWGFAGHTHHIVWNLRLIWHNVSNSRSLAALDSITLVSSFTGTGIVCWRVNTDSILMTPAQSQRTLINVRAHLIRPVCTLVHRYIWMSSVHPGRTTHVTIGTCNSYRFTLLRPMKFSIKFDTVKSSWSVVYTEGLEVIIFKTIYIFFSLWRLTLQRQTEQTQMKCSIMWHFIRVSLFIIVPI